MTLQTAQMAGVGSCLVHVSESIQSHYTDGQWQQLSLLLIIRGVDSSLASILVVTQGLVAKAKLWTSRCDV